MSILKKPYEISVWEDKWDTAQGKFVEHRLGIIGTHLMTSQNRAHEPKLSRSINGTKKFSFQMYGRYKDTITGEQVSNPFVSLLTNERKIKLKYGTYVDDDGTVKDQWYDFVIKDVNENSSNYLYTYQLEDLMVQELSKNGFNVVLSEEIRDETGGSNVGTAKQLGQRVLRETDWQVESDTFVEKMEEPLVYITIPTTTNIYPLLDPDIEDPKSKVEYGDETTIAAILQSKGETSIPSSVTVLAFYSSCTEEPYNFQFIYLPEGYEDVSVGENNVINVDNCQYLLKNPVYKKEESFSLPLNCAMSMDFGEDTFISNKYRGARYVFTQESEYIPILDKYCQKFIRNNVEYYGYLESEYISPVLVQNVISNADFKTSVNQAGTSGWVGTYHGTLNNQKETYGVKVESVLGEFQTNGGKTEFHSITDDFSDYSYDANKNYTPYLKIQVPKKTASTTPILINTGFYDNRALIKNVEYGETWILKANILGSDGTLSSGFRYQLAEVDYETDNGKYSNPVGWTTIADGIWGDDFVTAFLKINHQKVSDKEFGKKKIKLVIYPPSIGAEKTYYIKDLQLYRGVLKNPKDNPNELDSWVTPGSITEEGVIKTHYILLEAEDLKDFSKDENTLVKQVVETDNIHNLYTPVFSPGAEKTRTVDAKESNYFNILQSIAEKFEAWLVLDIKHDSLGAIQSKKVCFKNYAGKRNYASFRYGVNLKDIQRTDNSKNIVTKLIVKQNSNQYAQDGFCTITRASCNPTGENYIYDFRHYINQGMLDSADYIDTIYSTTGQRGEDVGTSDWNLKGYALRIKAINNKILPLNKTAMGLSTDLVKLKAEESVQQGLLESAKNNLEEVEEEFSMYTGVSPYAVSSYTYSSYLIPSASSEQGANALNNVTGADHWAYEANISVSKVDGKSLRFVVTLKKAVNVDRSFYFRPTFTFSRSGQAQTVSTSYVLNCTIKAGTNTGSLIYEPRLVDITAKKIIEMLTQHALYSRQISSSTEELAYYSAAIAEKELRLQEISAQQEIYLSWKKELNQLFFSKYSQFIQEGTWISEEHIDDNKYYTDAMSVMFTSSTPQVTYQINVFELSSLPGYELFTFDLGDTTYAEDPQFFGDERKVEIAVTEIVENLDDQSKNSIKTQTYKNQFQDLFQKITATVQQAQYSTGSYEKAVALAEADAAAKATFLSDALLGMGDSLAIAGQTTVQSGVNGITLIDQNTQNQMRLIGGAILMSVEDPKTGVRKWKTGLTPDGISASLVTAGTLNTGNISIMNGSDPLFRWDAFGLSAFDARVSGESNRISAPDPFKFVRFDKYGLYGVNNEKAQINGMTWVPQSLSDVHDNATFAITWQGLQVTGEDGTVVKLGRSQSSILSVYNAEGGLLLNFGEGKGEFLGNLGVGATLNGVPIEEALDAIAGEAVTDVTNSINAIRDQIIPDIQDDLNKEVQKLESLKKELEPLASYPSIIIIEEKPADINQASSVLSDDQGNSYVFIYYNKSTSQYCRKLYVNNLPEWREDPDFKDLGPSTGKIYFLSKNLSGKEENGYWYYAKDNTWKLTADLSATGISSYAGQAIRAEETYALMASMVGCNFKGGESLAGFMQEATDTYAAASQISEYTYVDEDGVMHSGAAGIITRAEKAEESAQMAAMNAEGSLAAITTKVDKSIAQSGMFAFKPNKEDFIDLYKTPEDTSKWQKELHYYKYDDAQEEYTVYAFSEENEAWTSQKLVEESPKVYLLIDQQLYLYYNETKKAWLTTNSPKEAGLDGPLASVEATVDKHSATLSALASKVNPNGGYNIAGVKAKADGDKSELQLVAIYGTESDTEPTVKAIEGATIVLGAGEGDSYIALNADKINFDSYAVNIVQKDNRETIFQAGNNQVYLAGWKADSNTLHQGTFGEVGGMYLSPTGYFPATNASYFGNPNTGAKWLIAAGSNFGVTTDGELYATAGRIGNMGIDALNREFNLNLIGVIPATDTSPQITASTPITLKIDGPQPDGVWYNVIEQFEPLIHYTLTVWCRGNGTLAFYSDSASYVKFGENILVSGENVTKKSITFAISEDDLGNLYQDEYPLYVELQGKTGSTVAIDRIKLEKGTQSTDWTPSGRGSMMKSDENDENYSWKFSPVDGMAMWNGTQTDDHLVLKVDEEGLYINGRIDAKAGGSIGGFSIGSGTLSYFNPENGEYLYGFTREGAEFPKGKLRIGDSDGLVLRAEDNSSTVGITSTKELVISCNTGTSTGRTSIIMGRPSDQTTGTSYKLQLCIERTGDYWSPAVKMWLKEVNNTAVSETIRCQIVYAIATEGAKFTTYTTELSISAYETESEQVVIPSSYSVVNKWFTARFKSNKETIPQSANDNAIEGGTLVCMGSLNSTVKTAISDTDVFTPKKIDKYIRIIGSLIPDTGLGTESDRCIGLSSTPWYEIHSVDISCTNLYYENDKSDVRVKNSIEEFSEKYDKFFDLWRPTRYKYNEGTSNRYHTGFIAQELVEALKQADLDTLDFAGVILNNPGKENECWYLRRDEFVAINTWQIQKLKPRVSSLEQSIINYENRISALEKEIENLKKS